MRRLVTHLVVYICLLAPAVAGEAMEDYPDYQTRRKARKSQCVPSGATTTTGAAGMGRVAEFFRRPLLLHQHSQWIFSDILQLEG